MGLTKRQIRDAKPSKKRVYLRDDDPKGLALCVHPTGRKIWVLDYRAPDGRKRRLNIGSAEAFNLDQARESAKEAQRDIGRGIDPLNVREERKAAPTVSEVLDRFCGEFFDHRLKQGQMKPRTAYEYRNQVEKYLRPKLGSKKVKDVVQGDIEVLLRPLAPILSNRVRALAQRFFNQCEKWGHRPQHTNPVRAIEKSPEAVRGRVLSSDEFSALGKALTELPKANEFAVLAIRLAALTGLRIGEIRKMRWVDIDLASGSVNLPDTKTGHRRHSLPTPAQALLTEAKKVGEFVVCGKEIDAPLNYTSIRTVWSRACKLGGIEDARPHDLRRSVMTSAAASGASAHALKDMLGHKTLTMATRYVQNAGEAHTKLREQVGQQTAAMMRGGETATVTRISSAEKI